MNRRRLMQRMIMMGGEIPYSTQILNTGPIAYWPHNELAGAAAGCYGAIGAAGNGTYSGVTLANTPAPGGGLAPLFDGATSCCDIYSAALNAAFSGDIGSIALWAKVLNIGVWTDNAYRRCITLHVDGNNEYYIDKTGAAGANVERVVQITPVGGGIEAPASSLTNNIAWCHIAITWSKAANKLKIYSNGAQDGADATGPSGWAGALDAAECCIGASTNALGGNWSGWLAHAAIWDKVLTPTEILALYNAGL